MSQTVYEIITDRILKELASGVAPWRKPWKPGNEAMNWVTGSPYRGINRLLTEPGGEYATFKQIYAAKGKIKPEETKNYTLLIFYKQSEKEEEDDTKEKETVRMIRYYRVYNVLTQCTGLASKRVVPSSDEAPNSIEEAERLVRDFADAPDIFYKSGRAVYRPFFDSVSVPPLVDFHQAEEFYSVLFHELVHSTGHPKRLNRTFGAEFGDELYSKEELIAEIGAAMLCGIAGIEQATIQNSAAYLEGWIKALGEDSRMIVRAAAAAQRAADYIQNLHHKTAKAG
ncbi:MAG: ArdC family protein [Bacillota bacterium]